MRTVPPFIKSVLFLVVPGLKQYVRFCKSQTSLISYWKWIGFWMKRDKRVYWPTFKYAELTHPNNIFCGINSQVGLRPGNYIQGNGGLFIGNYVSIAGNCGIISGNHDINNQTNEFYDIARCSFRASNCGWCWKCCDKEFS